MFIFPSTSHSHAAANDPRILEITRDLVANIDKVAYDSSASPVPVLSTTWFAKDGRENADSFFPLLLTDTIPLAPNLRIKFLGFVCLIRSLVKILILESWSAKENLASLSLGVIKSNSLKSVIFPHLVATWLSTA